MDKKCPQKRPHKGYRKLLIFSFSQLLLYCLHTVNTLFISFNNCVSLPLALIKKHTHDEKVFIWISNACYLLYS